jgi:MFS family permease
MVYPLVPLFLSTTLGAPSWVVGIIEGLAESTASIFKWVFGVLSDRVGKRKPFCVAGYGLAASTKPLLAFATAWPIVLCARVLDRFGKGLRDSPRDALIADSTPPDLRGRAFGFHRSGDSIGAVCGPLLTLLLLSVFGADYRKAFLIAFLPGLLSTFLLFPVHERATTRVQRSVFSFDLVRTNPALRRFLLVTLIFALGNSSDMFLILRAKQLGASSTGAVLMFALCNACNVLSSYPAGICSDRIGRKRVLVLGFLLFSAIYFAFGAATSLCWLWPAFAGYGIFLGLTDGVSKAMVVDLASSESRASALGLQSAIIGICTLPASVIAGLLWEWINPGAAFTYGAFTAAMSAVALVSLHIERPIE